MRMFISGLSMLGLAACMGEPPMDQPSGEPVEQITQPTDGVANEIGTDE